MGVHPSEVVRPGDDQPGDGQPFEAVLLEGVQPSGVAQPEGDRPSEDVGQPEDDRPSEDVGQPEDVGLPFADVVRPTVGGAAAGPSEDAGPSEGAGPSVDAVPFVDGTELLPAGRLRSRGIRAERVPGRSSSESPAASASGTPCTPPR